MKNLFLLFIVLIINFQSNAQGTGIPSIDIGPDQFLSCTNTCPTLFAETFITGQASDYTVNSIQYSPFSFTSGTQIYVNDDTWSQPVNIPFDIYFYGNTYSYLLIGANGVLTFDLTLANGYCQWSFNNPIPTPGPPPVGLYNNSINGAYHDVDPSSFYSNPIINYAIVGNAPSRAFVISYYQIDHFSCASDLFGVGLQTTQQIVLYETTNVIEVYIEDKPVCNIWNNGLAVIGLQNIDGTKGISPPGRNTGIWSATNEAWQFVPTDTPNAIINWYDDSLNYIASGDSITVCPIIQTTYTAEIVYTNFNGSQVVLTDQATVFPPVGDTSSVITSQSFCNGRCDGTINIVTSGSNGPFTFDIGNGPQSVGLFTSLCTGTYTVTIQNGTGCYRTNTVNLISDYSTNSIIDTTVCNTFSSPSGNYIWTNTGNYYDTISNAVGCDSFITVNLTVSNPSISINAIECNSYTSPSGNYIWTTSGTYNDTIIDSTGCESFITINLTISPLGSINNLVNDRYISCDQTCLILRVNTPPSTSPYTYQWSTGANAKYIQVCPNNTSTYTFTVTDNSGCTVSDTVTVFVSDTLCAAGKVTICRTMRSGQYNFCVDTGRLAYYIARGDVLGCCTNAPPLLPGPSGLGGLFSQVYPNPFTLKTIIEFGSEQSEHVTVEIFNSIGQRVANLFTGEIEASKIYKVDFNRGSLPTGIYISKVTSAKGEVQYHKLFISN